MRIVNSFQSSTARRLAFRILFALIMLTVSSVEALASHFRYASISTQPVLNAAGQPTGIMRFTIKSAWRRSAFGSPVVGSTINPETFSFGDGSSISLTLTVTSFSAAEDWVLAETTITHQYPAGNANSSWVASGSSSARIANLNNGANASWYYDTLVRPYTTNSSPTSALPPIVTVPKSTAAQFFVPASDVDRDTLTFRMSTNAGSGTTPTPPGFSINSSTGLVTWNNNTLDMTNFWFAQIIVEDRDASGTVKSRIPVDVLLKIVAVTSQAPRCLIDGLTTPKSISVQAGNPVSFVVTGNDPDGAVPVTLNTSGMPSGATLSPAMPFSGTAPISSTFNWTPSAADAGSRTISFSTTDNTGLVTLNSVNIFVENNQPPTITGPATLTTPFTPQTPITVQVADANGDALTVTWELDGVIVRTDSVAASQNATTLSYTGYGAVGPHTIKVTVKDTKNATASLTTAVTVTKADQTITFGALPARTFGDPDFTVAATASSGLPVTFSLVSGTCQVTGVSVHITAVGSCTVRASQGGDASYNPAPDVDQSFSIDKADQTITFAALPEKTYGDADFGVSATASSGLTVAFSASGACTVTGTSVHITGAGTCTLQASQAGDSTYSAASDVVRSVPIGKASLTVKADDKSRPYGAADPALTATISGFVNGETLATSGVTGAAALTTSATGTSPAGTYPITAGVGTLAAANYAFIYAPGVLTISTVQLTVTARSANRPYGAANPDLSTPLNVTGFVGGETTAVLTTQPTCSASATAASPIGSYPVTCSGAAATNYNFAYASGTLTIEPVQLTVTGRSASRPYGAANPDMSTPLSIVGFVAGETNAVLTTQPTCSTSATPASPIGSYPVACSGGAAVNYTFAYTPGALIVDAVQLTVTARSANRPYGAANPDISTPLTITGFITGETTAILTAQPTCSTTATPASPTGS